jgi:hypothetical protein
VPRYGGAKALTKHLQDETLKAPFTIEDAKIEVAPKIIDNSMVIGGTHIVRKPRNKMNTRMVKTKMPVKRTCRLEKATQHLYDLEDSHEPEKALNIELGLYQMEDY